MKWPLLSLMAIASFIIGCWGFYRDQQLPITESVYCSLLLFVMESGMGLTGLKLEIARFMAAGVAAYTIFLTILHLFHDRIRMYQPRLWRDHVVLAGLGEINLQIIKAFRDKKGHDFRSVVVIERDETNPLIKSAEEAGAIVIIGDATDPFLLKNSGILRARYLIAACREDEINFEIVFQLSTIFKDESRNKNQDPLKVFAHFYDTKFVNLLMNHSIIDESINAIDFSIFNKFEYIARKFINNYPLDYERLDDTDNRYVHLILIGLGRMGEALLMQTLRICHYANKARVKPRITIIDRNIDLINKKKLHLNTLNVHEICDIDFIHSNIETLDVMANLIEWSNDPLAIPTIAVCFANEHFGIMCSYKLFEIINGRCPIYVRISQNKGLASLLTQESTVSKNNSSAIQDKKIIPFGMIENLNVQEAVMHEDLDQLAKTIFYDYEAKTNRNEVTRSWKEICAWEKISNRAQADFIDVKLRAIGCYAAVKPNTSDDEEVNNFSAEEIELMAKMEHFRWTAERFLGGWKKYDGETPWEDLSSTIQQSIKNNHKMSPYLVEWELLSNDIKEYDRESVRNIFKIICHLDKKVYRCGL